MKDSHIYSRMNNPKVINAYLKILADGEIQDAKNLFANIILEANDHPRFSQLETVYNERFNN